MYIINNSVKKTNIHIQKYSENKMITISFGHEPSSRYKKVKTYNDKKKCPRITN